MFVIIKVGPPRALHDLENVVVQAWDHGENIEDQVNDPMEEDYHVNNTIEDDGTNTLI